MRGGADVAGADARVHGAAVVAVLLWASSRQMGNRAMGTTTSIPRVRILVLSRHVSLRSTQLLEDLKV